MKKVKLSANPIEVRHGSKVVYRGRDVPGLGPLKAFREAKRWGEGTTIAPVGYGRLAEPPKKKHKGYGGGGLMGMVFGKKGDKKTGDES